MSNIPNTVSLDEELDRLNRVLKELKSGHDGSDEVERKIRSVYNQRAEVQALLSQKIYYKINF